MPALPDVPLGDIPDAELGDLLAEFDAFSSTNSPKPAEAPAPSPPKPAAPAVPAAPVATAAAATAATAVPGALIDPSRDWRRMEDVKKFTQWAMDALKFSDMETASANLQKALAACFQ
jgi:hypothetical protein